MDSIIYRLRLQLVTLPDKNRKWLHLDRRNVVQENEKYELSENGV